MKVLQINAVCGKGSTGKICASISELLNEKGIENYILYSAGRSTHSGAVKYSSEKYIKVQALKSRIFGNYGFNSVYCTRKLLRYIEKISPDVVHLHNLHGHNCHLGMLFKYLKKHNIKVYWTFHDCFAFTGYCTHFDSIGCDKWQTECHNCPQHKKYSWFFDRSRIMFKRKKELFTNVDLTVITPSVWMAEMVKKSFLCDCRINVINNGIDLDIFKPSESDFRERYECADKFILLGVAHGWSSLKGLDEFINLANNSKDDWKIVLVGALGRGVGRLPENVIYIPFTSNQVELAEIYSAADVFVNPTMEDTFPTVNMEALACGTPVITYKTGGSVEIIDDSCGIAVDKGNSQELARAIERVYDERPFTTEMCLNRAKNFSAKDKFAENIRLYEV